MRIVRKSGDVGGVEREFVIVEKDNHHFVYLSPVGAARVPPDAPYFVTAPSIPYGVVASSIDTLRNLFAEFVSPDFANHEELKTLRTEYGNLKRSQIADQELKALHADREELKIYQAEERDRAQLKARLAVLDTPHDKRPKGV